jgi:DNA repair exonuclease SbcCD ATPase subunit
LSGLEAKFDSLAQKVQFADGTELGAKLRDYTQKGPEFRELDNFEQLIKEREASLGNLRAGVAPYFTRAGRMTEEIRPDSTTQLASEINSYVDEAREMLGVYGPITSAKEQIDFLKAEIQDAEKQLQASFIKARMEHLHDYNESYREFMTKVSLFQHLQTIKNELNGLENDMSSGFVPDELPPQIERLERARRGKYMSMQELITRSPNILELAPRARAMMTLMASINPYSSKASAEVTKKNIDNLKAERDGMSVLVRSANTSDATYMLMLQELRSVQAELTIVRRVKTALEHARDRVTQVQPSAGLDLQLTISEIMEEMLTQMGIEAPKYESSLNDNESGDLQNLAGSLVGKPFSLLTMEQVRWFARVIVIRVLAMNNSFPLVLNEPFGIGKEAVRESNLPFIFSLIEMRFQVMAMTSEANRFEAAYNAATAEQKMSLHTCARISLGS